MLSTSPDKRILDFGEVVEVVQTDRSFLRQRFFVYQLKAIESQSFVNFFDVL
jgi:hypothetical protein